MAAEKFNNVSVPNVSCDRSISTIEMFQRLINCRDIIIKSQQQHETDLTEVEKLNYLQNIYDTNKEMFLMRYGRYLDLPDLKNFEDAEKSSDLFYYSHKLKKSLDPKKSALKVKNRRYNYLKKILRDSDYFSDEEMKFRNPLLYQQYIEQYKTEEEILAEKEKQLSQQTLSQFLFGTMDKKLHEFRCNLEKEVTREQEEEEEEEEEHNKVRGLNENSTNTASEFREEIEFHNYMNEKVPVTDEEKERLKHEFIKIMEEQFLNGNDKFDYRKIDNDENYDDICDQDIEDSYFDYDDDNENSNMDQCNSTDYDY